MLSSCKVRDKLAFDLLQVERGFHTCVRGKLVELCQPRSSFKAALPARKLEWPCCGDFVTDHAFLDH
jgi:hypothetical protein